MAEPPMPDLSHLSAEERQIIEEVFQRQRAEEEKETQISQKADQELEAIEKQINERKETAQRLLGTQDDAICQICQKTKFADGIGHKCFYCQLRSCARCGGRTTSKNKQIWACSLCQKRQQILAKTGKWFQQAVMPDEAKGGGYSPGDLSPTSSAPRTPVPTSRNLASSSSQNLLSQRPSVSSASGQPLVGGPTGGPAAGGGSSGGGPSQSGQPSAHLVPSNDPSMPSARAGSSASVVAPNSKTTTQHIQRQASQGDRRRDGIPMNAPQLNGGTTGGGAGSGYRDSAGGGTGAYRDPSGSTGGTYRESGGSGGTYRDPSGSGSTRPGLIREPSRSGGAPPQSSSRRDLSPRRGGGRDYRSGPTAGSGGELRASPPLQKQHSSDRSGAGGDRLSMGPPGDSRKLGTVSAQGRPTADERRLRSDASFDERDKRRYANDARRDDRYDESHRSSRRGDLDERYSDRDDYDERADRRRSSPRDRSGDPLDRPSGSSTTSQHGYSSKAHSVNNERAPLASTRSSSRSGELRRGRSIRDGDSKRSEEPIHAVPATSANMPPAVHSNRVKKSRLTRQHRSMSSSEDELPSTSDAHSGDELVTRADTEITAEKDILRYIYGSQKMRNGKKSGLESPRRFERSTEVLNVPEHQSTVLPGDMLAAKIRTFLSHPVTWQPSADQRRLIGHMILHKTDGLQGGDLGLKVVGGRRSDTGRLGAFITRVKSGSVADTVGRLRAGDEVLEWNGRPLQNATFDQVYQIISSSRNDPQIELIVSRSASIPGGDDFLNVQRVLPNPSAFAQDRYESSEVGDYLLGTFPEPMLSHSQSITLSPQMRQFLQSGPSTSPLGHREAYRSHSSRSHKMLPSEQIYATNASSFAKGQIFGRIEISLFYSVAERQLVVTVNRALDLPPRPDGVNRNPYVKLFLLPDRSEKSRRQSAVLADTCLPVWNEPFYYNGLTEPMLMERVLEVTVWDYDKYETNSFLGETLIDFSVAPLDDEAILYTLVDMDEENPLRARLRHRRLSGYQVQSRPRSEMSHYPTPSYSQHSLHAGPPVNAVDYGGYGSLVPGPRQQLMEPNSGLRRSRTYDRGGVRVEDDWTMNSSSGYLSDHGYSNPPPIRYHHRDRRPRSANAMRPMTDLEMSASRVYTRNLPNAPWTAGADDEEELTPAAQPLTGLSIPRYGHDPRTPNGRLRLEAMQEQQQQPGGYGSDGSETLSVHSAQSITSRRAQRRIPNGDTEQHLSAQVLENNLEEFAEEAAITEATINKANAVSMKERKKSLMTRLIPGRNAPLEGKRTGFARSEEVGVPEGLSIPADKFQTAFTKQTSKESTDSSHSDNFGPIMPDGPLGTFVDNLGPGQVVGRQVLASPVLGEIQIGIAAGRNGIDVEIIRAKNLVVKPGVKINPAPYVKVYLLEGKQCIAKAKTNTVRKTTAPLFQQHLVFAESPRKKMIQVTVLGDYGRMERKSFMGIAQIKLDDLELGPEPLIGWYKLYHSSSLAGTGPVRKDSDTSLVDAKS